MQSQYSRSCKVILLKWCSYLNEAFLLVQLAFEAHDGQKRRSGEPFIIHPVEVARILGELVSHTKLTKKPSFQNDIFVAICNKNLLKLFFQELDWESVAAGLLHDTVEDTNVVTFERIEEEFGTIVRRIVEGETKVLHIFMSANFGNLCSSVILNKLQITLVEHWFHTYLVLIRYLNWEN